MDSSVDRGCGPFRWQAANQRRAHSARPQRTSPRIVQRHFFTIILSSLLHPALKAAPIPAADSVSPVATRATPEADRAPLLYDGTALRTTTDAELDATGIVAELLRARTPQERQQAVHARLNAIGFAWLSYGVVALVRGRVHTQSFFTDFANPEWVRRYFEHNHMQADPRHQDTPLSSLPLQWDLEQLQAQAALAAPSAQRQRFLDDMRECGLHSGLLFRVTSPTNVNAHTVIGMQSLRSGRDWITSEVTGQALMLGFSVHDFLVRHLPPAEAERKGVVCGPAQPEGVAEVSPTQHNILAQLMQGRSDKEIANRLSLSAHAVDYHMRQLRRRFAVRNRLQLVNAVAGAGGLSCEACV